MQLRSLNMMYEISLSGKNLMIFIPTDSKGFSIPTPVGVEGIKDLFEKSDVKNLPDKGDVNKKKTQKDS